MAPRFSLRQLLNFTALLCGSLALARLNLYVGLAILVAILFSLYVVAIVRDRPEDFRIAWSAQVGAMAGKVVWLFALKFLPVEVWVTRSVDPYGILNGCFALHSMYLGALLGGSAGFLLWQRRRDRDADSAPDEQSD